MSANNTILHDLTLLNMKKFLVLIGAILFLSTTTLRAEKTTTKADTQNWGHLNPNTGVNRSPCQLPNIEIVYDSDMHTIEFVCDGDYTATVWLRDQQGNIVDTADSLNTIFDISSISSTTLYIRIESEQWYATAEINI